MLVNKAVDVGMFSNPSNKWLLRAHTPTAAGQTYMNTLLYMWVCTLGWGVAERLIDSERGPASWEERHSHRNTGILPQRGGTGKREPERWASALDLDVSPLKSHFDPQERKITNGISNILFLLDRVGPKTYSDTYQTISNSAGNQKSDISIRIFLIKFFQG